MRLSRGTLGLMAVVALSLVSAEGAAAKCSPQMAWPGLEPGETIVLVDGSIVVAGMLGGNEAPALGGRREGTAPLPRAQSGSRINIRPFNFDLGDALDDPSDIHSLEIICWNPETGEFQPGGGVSMIEIWTKGFVESTRAPLEALLRAQQAHFSRHSRYAQSLDDLVEFGVPRDAMLELSATSTGWSATTPRDDVDYRCLIYSGDVEQELASAKEHEVVCRPEKARISRALLEMYGASG